ncbi:MAG: hypothetical protein J7I99_03650 [Methanophagales archaeon]|nr:hypothetical protein [Methanophagales archaeon]
MGWEDYHLHEFGLHPKSHRKPRYYPSDYLRRG